MASTSATAPAQTAPKVLANWIDGRPAPHADPIDTADTSHFLPVATPATGAVIAFVPLSTPEQVNQAVASSVAAFDGWSKRTVKDRVQILIRFHQLIVKHQNELADIIVLEHGKTKPEALAEISKANETLEYAISLPQLLSGRILEVSRGVTCSDSRRPLGVVCSIVPFNFPIMVPFWTLPISIAAGNTLIIKPSEKVPLTLLRVMELMNDAGFPPGIVNLVNGTAQVVNQLVDHKDIKAVTFVGTSHVAEMVAKRGRCLNKRVLALGGAKNHLVAYPDCLIEMTASDVVASFTGCAGQRCMAASVLLTIGPQAELIDAIVKKASQIVAGQGQAATSSSSSSSSSAAAAPAASHQMGPVIDDASKRKIESFIAQSEAAGATILLDGRSQHAIDKGFHSSQGSWIGPTIVHHKSPSDAALHAEIFGPFLSILTVASKEAAI
eukprot:jgi/Hompol1/4791/HPOL_003879-RA